MKRNARLILLLAILLGLLAMVAGCAGKPSPVISNPIITASGNVAQAGAHVEAAEALNEQAKPHGDETAQALLDGVSHEHGSALAKLADTQADLNSALAENQTLHTSISTITIERDAAQGNLGYRAWTTITTAWRWFWRWFWIITIGGGIVHLVLLILGVAFSGPFGVFAMKAAKIVNPWTWALWLAQHVRSKSI